MNITKANQLTSVINELIENKKTGLSGETEKKATVLLQEILATKGSLPDSITQEKLILLFNNENNSVLFANWIKVPAIQERLLSNGNGKYHTFHNELLRKTKDTDLSSLEALGVLISRASDTGGKTTLVIQVFNNITNYLPKRASKVCKGPIHQLKEKMFQIATLKNLKKERNQALTRLILEINQAFNRFYAQYLSSLAKISLAEQYYDNERKKCLEQLSNLRKNPPNDFNEKVEAMIENLDELENGRESVLQDAEAQLIKDKNLLISHLDESIKDIERLLTDNQLNASENDKINRATLSQHHFLSANPGAESTPIKLLHNLKDAMEEMRNYLEIENMSQIESKPR